MAGKGPSTSLFAKQELHASKLIILPNCFSIAFVIIGAVSIGIGYAFLDASNKVRRATPPARLTQHIPLRDCCSDG
jgi:hypothetical protein